MTAQPSQPEVQRWLVAQLSERLALAPAAIELDEPFDSYGLSSQVALELSGDLEVWLGRTLAPTVAWEYPTIRALAAFLTAAPADAPAASARPAVQPPADGIAIIGMACRLPGASDLAAFWQLLCDGVDAIRVVPQERWRNEDWYDPDPSAAGKTVARWGGFLDRVDAFDPAFFGISRREAARMDPQQRVLLELAWAALEDAGIVPASLRGSSSGVFIGIATNDYSHLHWNAPQLVDAYTGTSVALSIAANRLSYCFDLHGPSMAVDTACSSSLVALHLACQALQRAEAPLALVGGVNLLLDPTLSASFTKAGVMARDGRCKAFDARADGYVRSEGAGVVVLKPLHQAQHDGDHIYAVIRGSTINQDGRTNGLLAPNPHAQEALLRAAYAQAGIAPQRVQYLEAHGTGTLLGDAIEVRALAAVLGAGRALDQPCAIGSVKTNIGHLEAGAGIAGLIKVALMIWRRQLVPSLHMVTPNPHIPFDQLPLRVQQQAAPWVAEPLIAGVSSFGFGGTNAHVVLTSVEQGPPPPGPVEQPPYLVPLSAQHDDVLRTLAARSAAMLQQGDETAPTLAALGYALSRQRSHHHYRLAAVAHTRDELVELLRAYGQGDSPAGLSVSTTSRRQAPQLVLVFPGQGGQWPGMGRELAAQSPVFRAALEQCDAALRPYVAWSLLDLIEGTAAQAQLQEIDVVQPALWALEVALARVWLDWGIRPDAVIGHSMGELAAAQIAGILSLADAARIICQRSRLLRRVRGRGAMALVELSADQAAAVLAPYGERATISACNSPTTTILGGEPAALDAIIADLERQGVFCRRVKVDVASHSPSVDGLRAELQAAIADIRPQPGEIRLCSTVLAQLVEGQTLDAAYWVRNLRQPVQFAAGIAHLLTAGETVFVEVSPHPTLLTAIADCGRHAAVATHVVASLRRDRPERASLLQSLGALYTLGCDVAWQRHYPVRGAHLRLPSYPFRQERYWFDGAAIAPPAAPAAPARVPPGAHDPLEAVMVEQLHAVAQVVGQQLDTLQGLVSETPRRP